MTSQEFLTTEVNVFEKLTHSYDDNLSRILWINRTSSGPPESGPDTQWTWPEKQSTVPVVTFPARLTHVYVPTTVAASTEMTTTSAMALTTLPSSDYTTARFTYYLVRIRYNFRTKTLTDLVLTYN